MAKYGDNNICCSQNVATLLRNKTLPLSGRARDSGERNGSTFSLPSRHQARLFNEAGAHVTSSVKSLIKCKIGNVSVSAKL